MKNIKILSLVLVLFMAMACKKNDEVVIDDDLPACIEEILTDSTSLAILKNIQATVVDSKIHYWLNTEARRVDGSEFIVSEQCDTICSFGGWFPTDCVADYEASGGWQIVWLP